MNGLAVEVGIAHHHHLAIGIVHREHVGTGTYRVPVQGDIALLHPRLAVEAVRLPGYRGEKRHGQPVQQLRVLALDPDPVGVAVDDRHAFQRVVAQIQEASLWHGLRDLLQGVHVVGQADDVVAHQAQYR